MSQSRSRKRKAMKRGVTATQILAGRGTDWNIGCSYGCHAFVRDGGTEAIRFMRCTICDARYACTDQQWAALREAKP